MTRQFQRFGPKLGLYCIFFIAHARNCLISTSGLKSDVTIVFLDPDFLRNVGIPAIREHLRQKLAYLCLHEFSRPFSQYGDFEGKIGEGAVQC